MPAEGADEAKEDAAAVLSSCDGRNVAFIAAAAAPAAAAAAAASETLPEPPPVSAAGEVIDIQQMIEPLGASTGTAVAAEDAAAAAAGDAGTHSVPRDRVLQGAGADADADAGAGAGAGAGAAVGVGVGVGVGVCAGAGAEAEADAGGVTAEGTLANSALFPPPDVGLTLQRARPSLPASAVPGASSLLSWLHVLASGGVLWWT